MAKSKHMYATTPLITLNATKFVKVPLTRLQPHPEQPNFLRLMQGISRLMNAIMRTQLVAPPWVVAIPGKPGYYYVVNGNRRVEACRRLGITELVVEVLPSTTNLTSIFAPAQSAEKWGSKEYLASWALAALISADRARTNLSSIPNPMFASQIEEFIRLVGRPLAIKYGQKGNVSPNVVIRVGLICEELVARGQEKLANNPTFRKELTCWLLDTKSYKNVGDAHNFWSHEGYYDLFDEVIRAFKARRKYVSVLRPSIHKKKNSLRFPTTRYSMVATAAGVSVNRRR